ncbi:MAG: ABC transporter permease [Calditrichia bacterium]
MLKTLSLRCLQALLTLWGVLSLTFFMMHLAPGDPASLFVSPEMPADVLQNLRQQMGLNQPLMMQYLHWLREFSSGNFGFSFSHSRPVLQVLRQALPNTLQLTLTVFILQFFAGILLGIVIDLWSERKTGAVLNQFLLFIYSIPGFWLALLAIMVFSYALNWLPSSQMSGLETASGWGRVWDRLRHIILPALVLILPFAAFTARFVAGQLKEVMRQDYIRTAFSMGLKKNQVIGKYALKNALLPVITLTGLQFPFLLGGAVITEYIFGWPGMGRLAVEAIYAHDFPLILGSTFVAAVAVILGNLFSDILYSIVDPRINSPAAGF